MTGIPLCSRIPHWTQPHVAIVLDPLFPVVGEGRAHSGEACHDGGSNPQIPVSDFVAVATPPNATSGVPSRFCENAQSRRHSASGVIIGMEFSKLAQHVEGCHSASPSRTALKQLLSQFSV